MNQFAHVADNYEAPGICNESARIPVLNQEGSRGLHVPAHNLRWEPIAFCSHQEMLLMNNNTTIKEASTDKQIALPGQLIQTEVHPPCWSRSTTSQPLHFSKKRRLHFLKKKKRQYEPITIACTSILLVIALGSGVLGMGYLYFMTKIQPSLTSFLRPVSRDHHEPALSLPIDSSIVKEDTIKNKKELENLINYFDCNRICIPCYALRKKLDLRVSSNQVEKANDLVVPNQQKHNGMSWSASGSTSLATLTAVRRNGEDHHWLLKHDIRFTFDARTQESAA